ncbi:ECF transporter S component [Lacticigenium naphthae]|uniref:ECF transporter S component n=1 Tax=Lacticigenium naphthae TaxID=515351 RepID=UPI0003FC8751|nr:ECF transporter S component [Lacticigenium naphthae]
MQNSKTKKLVGIAVLASMAFVLAQLSFPILPAASFLKVDFSDVPVILGMFLYGPVSGIVIAFIRSLLHYVQTGGELGIPIGDTTAFIASIVYTLPIYYIVKNHYSGIKSKIAATVSATLSLTIVLSFLNWAVIAPAYMAVMGFDVGSMRNYLLLAVVPFNLLKGPMVAFAFFAVYSKLKPWIDKNKKKLGIKKRTKLNIQSS